MKLNKVLALALSGVMAVSMLAGCSNNSGNGGQEGEGEQTPATIQVAADLNKAISEDTQKKVTFTDDGALQLKIWLTAVDFEWYCYPAYCYEGSGNPSGCYRY